MNISACRPIIWLKRNTPGKVHKICRCLYGAANGGLNYDVGQGVVVVVLKYPPFVMALRKKWATRSFHV